VHVRPSSLFSVAGANLHAEFQHSLSLLKGMYNARGQKEIDVPLCDTTYLQLKS
jgi:hypothetical protein